MKKILLILLLMASIMAFPQKNYNEDWSSVDSLSNLGQPRSALQVVNKIYDDSKKDNNAAQFVKAAIYRMSLNSTFEEYSLQTAIQATEQEIDEANTPVKGILHSLLAELYWRFYEQNRYQILERTTTSEITSGDINTWDLKKVVEHCLHNYYASLQDKVILQSIPLDNFNALLIGIPESRAYRPTLYDFLVHRALDFLINSESSLTQPAFHFQVDKPEYFSPSSRFSSLEILTRDSLSFDYLAINYFQEAISFHLADPDPKALIDLELKRLTYIHRICVLPEKDSLFLASLQRLQNQYSAHEASSEIAYLIAQQWVADGNKYQPLQSEDHKWSLKKAFDLASETMKRFPEAYGTKQCASIQYPLQQPSLDIMTEYAAVPGKPALASVTYRNIKKLYFRIIKLDPDTDKNIRENSYNRSIPSLYLNQEPVLEWTQVLPDDGDLQHHRAEIRLPALDAGYYVMLASTDEQYAEGGIASVNRFWRTGISYISRRNDNGSYEIYVLGRQEGEPLKGIKVQCYFREYVYTSRTYTDRPGQVFYTDANGFLTIPAQENDHYNQYYLVFKGDKDLFITESYFSGYYNKYDTPKTFINTHFFTDRAIYRPGQTIYFKGIALEREDKETRVKAGYKTTVFFYDVNGQKISSQQLVSNEYGSFSGSFTAPVSVLTGSMNIQCETGAVSVLVEEYKRPKFEVTFNPVTGSYKIGEQVVLSGKAVSYAGSNVTDAKVNYRVVRSARFPYMWWGWREWLPQSPEMEISNGSVNTDENGIFKIDFTAIPDLSLERKYNPVFNYQVYADVTDLNGETHSSETTVSVGYNALLIHEDIPSQLNLDSLFRFTLSTTNLNGQKEAASGKISVWKLKDPDRILRDRSWTRPDKFTLSRVDFEKEFPNDIYDNEGDYHSWEKEKQIFSAHFDTSKDSLIEIADARSWAPGRYLYSIETTDSFGEKVEKTESFLAFSQGNSKVPAKETAWFSILKKQAEPGESIPLLLGSAAKNVRVILEIIRDNKLVSRKVLTLNQNQALEMIPVIEEYRGNFTINAAFVKMNRSWQFSQNIVVPWTNRKLDIRFESFRSKLLPGQEEEWLVTIAGSKGEKVAAELLAGMYDASLDAFTTHNWLLNVFNYYNTWHQWDITSAFGSRGSYVYWKTEDFPQFRTREYDRLNWYGYETYSSFHYRPLGGMKMGLERNMVADETIKAPLRNNEGGINREETLQASTAKEEGAKGVPPVPTAGSSEKQAPQPAKVRSNFNETAFFFPQLKTNENGEVVIRFKMPESLTRWKMMGLAYTKDLKVGQVQKTLITQKDLMVFPNAPRFFRENDRMQFSVKVANVSKESLNGTVSLHFFDAYTLQPLDERLHTGKIESKFEAAAGANTVVSWDITIPEGLTAIAYKVIATAGNFSDGEEAVIPVLTNRMLVTESLPLPIKGGETKKYTLSKLYSSGSGSKTLRNYRLSLEFTSNPAWYAVQALPYLMEYPYECAEQLFSRFYANSIATHVANSSPRIKAVFESWKNLSPDALKSNLEKNQELKNILLEESPWVREATSEKEQKQRIAILFDLNRMGNETAQALKKLMDLQAPNGGWPWFTGMPDSRYITQHIVTGLGHLDHLGINSIRENPQVLQALRQAVYYLDARLSDDLLRIKREDKDYLKNDHLGSEAIQYLYARSYFMTDFPLEKKDQEAFTYFKDQSARFWKPRNIYMKGMIALALNRYSEGKTAGLIMRSLSETALHNDEMGMYWRAESPGWFWYQAPIETQALMIEAFDEVLNDTHSVEELKVWLLKQKQTQNWKTTKATTEAVYALLLRGSDLLASDKLAQVQVGSQLVDPLKTDGSSKPEAGTGYFKTAWTADEIKPEMGKVTVTNLNPTVAWGALYWQYFEQLDKIIPAETPLKLEKKLFREINTDNGPVIEPIDGETKLLTGDKVVVRIVLHSDRDMEYVHLKDMRASAFEPLNVISGYKWQDGLGYYEATRDASTNFFIGYLPKGTYVFEYRLFATQKGEFSNGITSIQCMYAPEFSAHSEGIRVRVQ